MHRILAGVLILAFLVSDVRVYAQGVIDLPVPGTRLALSPTFAPPLLKGIKVYRNDPFRFDFILDKGDAEATDEQVKIDSTRLIKYFLASLTVPEKDLWVNLSPYEKDRIVPEAFGQTEMGRDLLAQDYILKQITASVIYPEGEVGKEFWARVYAEAQRRYGSADVPVDTFNKVWIIPEKATVYENKDAAFVVESRLKVMLEEDYLALEKNTEVKEQTTIVTNKLGSDIVREVVIPILEKEVNEGKNFAPLRQVYHSLILATWYKRKVKASILGQAYVDKQKTVGIDIADKNEKEKIWQQYVEAFRKGAFNLIKEERDVSTQEAVPRKYFSGGTDLAMGAVFKTMDAAELPNIKKVINVQIKIDMAMSRDIQRVWDALDTERPVVAESSQYGIRLYFPGQGIHIYLDSRIPIFVSNMGGNPGKEIKIGEDAQRKVLTSKVGKLLAVLRDSNKGVEEYLKVIERNEAEKIRMAELKKMFARPVVTDEVEREKILSELSHLFDIQMEKMTPDEIQRIQELVASLGWEPFYSPEKIPLADSPSRPMDKKIYDIKQGDVIYIQYDVIQRDSHETLREEHEGLVRRVPSFGGKPVVELTDGTEIGLKDIVEILVDGGKGGHYQGKVGGRAPWSFLMGGKIERKLISSPVNEADIEKDGILKGYVNWAGVDKYLPMKFITECEVMNKTARMTGEKVVVMETPGGQNDGVFIYKRANGEFGDHEMGDINRIYKIGQDSEVAQLKTHFFSQGDRVIMQASDGIYYGVVDSFYTQPFVGRRMVVKIDDPVDPEKSFVHVKFSNELDGVLIDAKNESTKSQIQGAFQTIYDVLNVNFIIHSDVLEDPDSERFWESFKMTHEILFKKEKKFNKDDFNVKALDAFFQKATGMGLEEMAKGLSQENEGGGDTLRRLRSSLSEQDRITISKAFKTIRYVTNFFAGPKVVGTGTVPWCVREQDFIDILSGNLPDSNFSLFGLLKYFEKKTVMFEDRLRLAYKIAGAREKMKFLGVLSVMFENLDKLERLSPSAADIAVEEYVKKLDDLDDILSLGFVFGVPSERMKEIVKEKNTDDAQDNAMGLSKFERDDSIGVNEKKKTGGVDLNPERVELKTTNSGEEIRFDFDPAMLQQMQSAAGVTPVIVGINLIESVSAFMGVEPVVK